MMSFFQQMNAGIELSADDAAAHPPGPACGCPKMFWRRGEYGFSCAHCFDTMMASELVDLIFDYADVGLPYDDGDEDTPESTEDTPKTSGPLCVGSLAFEHILLAADLRAWGCDPESEEEDQSQLPRRAAPRRAAPRRSAPRAPRRSA